MGCGSGGACVVVGGGWAKPICSLKRLATMEYSGSPGTMGRRVVSASPLKASERCFGIESRVTVDVRETPSMGSPATVGSPWACTVVVVQSVTMDVMVRVLAVGAMS